MATPSPSEAMRAMAAVAAVDRQPLSLLEIRPAGDVLNLLLRRPDGSTTTLRAATADAPALELLHSLDRSRVHAALLRLHRGGPPDAA